MFATHKLALIGILVLTAGCETLSGLADPFRGVDTLDEVDLATEAEMSQLLTSDSSVAEDVAADTETAETTPNLWNLFRRGREEAPEAEIAEDMADPSDVIDELDPQVSAVIAQPPEPKRSGLFGLFRAPTASDVDESEPIDEPAGGLLAMFTRPDAPPEEVVPEQPLEFGMLRAACGTRNGDLGSVIYTVSGFKVYDTAPGATSQRMHYITGFDDGCPRAFLGALVLPGDVGTHEIVRYSNTRVRLEYSETDQAYERIKASFCKAAEGEPCGNQLERLGRLTTFVTVYETFGAGPVWAEFLLHDGEVAAVDLESL